LGGLAAHLEAEKCRDLISMIALIDDV